MQETRRPTGISLTRTGQLTFQASNERGGQLAIGSGNDQTFTPVELLLAGIAGCSGIDVDLLTCKRVEPASFEVEVSADRVKDQDGNRLDNIQVSFNIVFPEGETGDRARQMLDRAIQQTQERLCTVSRTVELGTPVAMGVTN